MLMSLQKEELILINLEKNFKNDLAKIYFYLSNNISKKYADKIIHKILSRIYILEYFPYIR